MLDGKLTMTMSRLLQALKREEHSKIEIKAGFVDEEDKELVELLPADRYDSSKALFADIELLRLNKIEDWFKDGTTIVRTLRNGRGRNPYTDSTIKMRLEVQRNGETLLSNYPDMEPVFKLPEDYGQTEEEIKLASNKPYDYYTSETMFKYPKEVRPKYFEQEAASIFTVTLDEYELPSLFIKIIKSMKKSGVVEVTSTRMDKILTNFPNEKLGFDQYKEFKEGDEIKFRITLLDSQHPTYFFKMLVADKLRHVLKLKATATRFFKSDPNVVKNHLKKAADIYQKINGYYNFGDSTNNYAKEDETSEVFQETNKELQSIKLTTFNNLTVCKHKMGEWQSVIGITDQVLSEQMDPNNVKAMYFRGYAFIKQELFEEAVDVLKELVALDPKHAEGAKLLAQAKQLKKAHFEKESKKFAAMFK